MNKSFLTPQTNRPTHSIFKLGLVHWLVLWTLILFISKITFAESAPEIKLTEQSQVELKESDPIEKIDTAESLVYQKHSPFRDLRVSLSTYETAEEYLQAKSVQNSLGLPTTNILTITDLDRAIDVRSHWMPIITEGMFYVEYPTVELAKHFSTKSTSLNKEKLTLVVLTATTSASEVNFYYLVDQETLSQNSFLLVMNSVLYGYLSIPQKDWQDSLQKSESIFKTLKERRSSFVSLDENETPVTTSISSNLAFFLHYNLSVQGILYWSDLTAMFEKEMIHFVLTNSIMGMPSSRNLDSTMGMWSREPELQRTSLVERGWAKSLLMTVVNVLKANEKLSGQFSLTSLDRAPKTAIFKFSSIPASGEDSETLQTAHWSFVRGHLEVKAADRLTLVQGKD